MMHRLKRILLPLLFCCHYSLWSQNDSIPQIILQEVAVNALKTVVNLDRFPIAYTKKELSLNWSGPSLSLQEYLVAIPGQLSFNQSNYAQDLRLSIRGFGARSAFGIRGIKLIVDGIPETTPDGQGQLDNLPLPLLSKIELVRGPNALRYGNASGGVLSFTTLNKLEEEFHQLNLRTGSFGQKQIGLINSFGNEKVQAYILLNHQNGDGYRRNSELENKQFNLKVNYHLNARSKLNFQVNSSNSPYANDAGGQTFEEFNNSPRSARGRNLDYNTGEKINQIKTGAAYSYQNKSIQINTYSFISNRKFEGRLPFNFGGWVNLNRDYGGLGGLLTVFYNQKLIQWTTQLGVDTSYQKDRRKRFYNQNGIKGEITLDQDENFNSLGAYIIQHIELRGWTLNGGIRWDSNLLEAIDRINPRESNKKLNAWSPQLGISYRISPQISVFGNYAKSFETPTLSELSANPSGESGFNDLSIQEAKNREVGFKFNHEKTKGNIVLFNISTQNDLVPYELDEFPGRTFYRNAGQTSRKGIELDISHQFSFPLNFQLSLNYTNFKYVAFQKNDQNLNGKKLPGIPTIFGGLTAKYSFRNNWVLDYSKHHRGKLFPDDNNNVIINGFSIDNLFLTIPLNLNRVKKTLFNIGITNLFDVIYTDNVRINAFGGRYYEAGNARAFYTGIQLKF